MARVGLSAFEVIGPAMVGPSSSHTAGAIRLGLAARRLLGEEPVRALIGLHGSFAATGRGHATDLALLAGILGDGPDTTALPGARDRAVAAGLSFKFEYAGLGHDAHPNSARLRLESARHVLDVTGASLGGGMIALGEIDGHATQVSFARPTLVCWHADRAGFLASLTAAFARAGVNIATINTSRRARGGRALTVVEADDTIPPAVTAAVSRPDWVTRACVTPALP